MMKTKLIFKRTLLALGMLFVFSTVVHAQKLVVKNNLLYDLTATPNIGAELRLAPKWTAQLYVGGNFWDMKKSVNRKWRHVVVQPEARYWLCNTFNGHFFGINLLYSHYNASNIDFPFGIWSDVKNRRRQGDLGAIGLSYGYSHMLSKRWSIEGTVGLGYGVTRFREYDCVTCGAFYGSRTKHLLMPTKLAVSIVYNIL
jgi:hypothetical protein